ncbi:MAG: glycosyltransferase family 2 protein [Candidatus Thiodiazotropha endolucinida]|nr:glycosyltransferase family 2 protein [Candidatus Thiodiazotropha taylori]MCW4225969.1 glycosyltransferase family 2 protein [Candidatus Thiodiazotropha endolucinida]
METRYKETPVRKSLRSYSPHRFFDTNHVFAETAKHRLAVILPCYNEQAAIARVVTDFRQALPEAVIYVFDNGSSDGTADKARNAGAIVRQVNLPGKGNVVRRMFADVDADIYIMADGDATYHAASAPTMIRKLLRDNLDMVVGIRNHQSNEAYRRGHKSGNRLLTSTTTSIFGSGFTDMLSGYRVFSRRFVKSFPAMSHGFEIETELAIHALELRMPCGEVSTPYGARPEESESKLRTYSDGFRILKTIIKLFAMERPFRFYGLIAFGFILSAIILAVPIVITYLETGMVPRFPTAILSIGLAITGAIGFITGLILETVTVGRREIKQLHYLSMPPVSSMSMNED